MTLAMMSSRFASDSEVGALRALTACFLPACLRWLGDRAIQPPTALVEDLWRFRLERQAADLGLEASELASLSRASATRTTGEESLQCAALVRDIKRSAFPVTLRRMAVSTIEQVTCAASLVPFFSTATAALYVPEWLVGEMPHSLFAPSSLFPGARPTSRAWLLLDALVVTAAPPLRSVQSHYGFVE